MNAVCWPVPMYPRMYPREEEERAKLDWISNGSEGIRLVPWLRVFVGPERHASPARIHRLLVPDRPPPPALKYLHPILLFINYTYYSGNQIFTYKTNKFRPILTLKPKILTNFDIITQNLD